MFIQGFLQAGVSWNKVRKASLTAARLLQGEAHPFAMKKWFVDPAGIYLKLVRQHGEHVLVEVVGDAQVAMSEALEPYIYNRSTSTFLALRRSGTLSDSTIQL